MSGRIPMCAKPHSVSLSSCGLKSSGESRTTAVCNACDAEVDVSANPDNTVEHADIHCRLPGPH